MVEPLDVQMYILAVKALYRRLRKGKIVAIHGFPVTLSTAQRDLIHKHLGPVEFRHVDELDTGTCQRGGTWERLVFCIDRTVQDYVIQIDSDILCIGSIDEVLSAAEQNRAFALAEGIPIQPLPNWIEPGLARKSENIVTIFEIKANEFPDAPKWLYLRGSSGFAGFSKGGVTRQMLETFHAGGLKVHGERWKEWGTEQIASNCMVANSPGAIPLPYPKYSTWEPEYATFQKKGITKDMSLLHFIGAFRFVGDAYRMLANREIEAMLEGK